MLRLIGRIVFVGVLLVAGATFFFTWNGSLRWYFRVNGNVLVDGHKTAGYMHANTERTILLLTRTDSGGPETYLVPLREEKMVLDCGKWHPVRFLPMPVGHVNPPCSAFTEPAEVRDPAIDKTLVWGMKSVEFSTAAGKRVRGEW